MTSQQLLTHLRAAKDHADRHFDEPLSVASLAEAAHVSRYHFMRCFADTYGETPMRYLTRRRVERAQDLLRTANLEDAAAMQRMLDKGSLSPVGLQTDDCHGAYAQLSARDVEFTQPPADRPYGVEAILRDDSGSWLVLVERRAP